MRRLWWFIGEWQSAVASAGSLRGRIIRMVLLLFAVARLLFPIVIPNVEVPTALTVKFESPQARWMQGEVAIELMVAAGLVGVLLAWAGGAAWLRSSGPRLLVGDELFEDTLQRVYWLRVEVQGPGTARPRAYVADVVDASRHPVETTVRAAIELLASHHTPSDELKVTEVAPESFGVLGASASGVTIHGKIHSPHILTTLADGTLRKVYLRVNIGDVGEGKAYAARVVRWFSFEPDATSPMFHRWAAEEPPAG